MNSVPLPKTSATPRAYSSRGAMLGTTWLIIQVCAILLMLLIALSIQQPFETRTLEFEWGTLSALVPKDWTILRDPSATQLDDPVLMMEYAASFNENNSGRNWWTNYRLPQDDSVFITIYLFGTDSALVFPGVTKAVQAAEQQVAPLNRMMVQEFKPSVLDDAPAASGSFFFTTPAYHGDLNPTQAMLYALIFKEGEVIEFRAVCNPSHWMTYQPIFQKVLKSIHFEKLPAPIPEP